MRKNNRIKILRFTGSFQRTNCQLSSVLAFLRLTKEDPHYPPTYIRISTRTVIDRTTEFRPEQVQIRPNRITSSSLNLQTRVDYNFS